MWLRLRGQLICGAAALSLMGCEADDGQSGAAAPRAAEEFDRAADALIAKLGSPGEKTEMPAPTDPAVLAFEQEANRALTALGTPSMPVTGLDSFQASCGKTAEIMQAYASAGTGPDQAATPERMQENVLKHIDQMFTPMLFSAHCGALHIPVAETLDTDHIDKERALKQIRDGLNGQFIGLLQSAAAEDFLQPAQRQRAMELLAADASKFAMAMTPKQREEALALTQEVRGSLPEELRSHADKVSQDLQQAKCGKLCSL